MTGANILGHSRSLAHQVTDLEKQLTQRRQRVRTLVTGIKRKATARMNTPGVLLAAVGIGMALEHISREQGLSLANVLDAASESFRLLPSFKPSHPASR